LIIIEISLVYFLDNRSVSENHNFERFVEIHREKKR